MDAYVESGYIESGYIEGDIINILPEDIGERTSLKFFISKGKQDVAGLTEEISKSIGDDVAVLFVPEQNKMMLGGANGFISFFGSDKTLATRVSKIETDFNNAMESFRDEARSIMNQAREDIKNVYVNVVMKAPDGTIIARPDVIKDGANFSYSVPEEVAGAVYSVEFEISGCRYDQ